MYSNYLFLLAVCLFVSCSPSQAKMDLCRSWKYDLSAMRRHLSTNEADFATLSYMESIMGGLQGARLEFLKNGILEFRIDELKQSGRWRLRKKGSELLMRITDKEQVHKVLQINADTLIIEPIGGEGPSFPRILVQDTPAD